MFNDLSQRFSVGNNEEFLWLLKQLEVKFIIGEDLVIPSGFDSLVDGAKYRLKEPSIISLAANGNVPTTASNASGVGVGIGGTSSTFKSSTSASNPVPTFAANAPATHSVSFLTDGSFEVFSLGIPASSSAPSPSTGNMTRGVEAATLSDEENEDPANAGDESKGADVETIDVYSIKVKAYHHRKKGELPTLFATEILKLQEFKSDPSKKRMVMRDSVTGFLRLNIAISKGMKFEKHATQKGRIDFGGVHEEERGFEPLTIRCKEDFVDELHSKLVEMAS